MEASNPQTCSGALAKHPGGPLSMTQALKQRVMMGNLADPKAVADCMGYVEHEEFHFASRGDSSESPTQVRGGRRCQESPRNIRITTPP